jgi:hypothetical protein
MTGPAVQYTALRSLYGVASGATVDYHLPVAYAGMTHGKRAIGATRTSLSGLRERYHIRVEHVYSITTKPLREDQWLHLRMFLDSVERSETFLFAPNGLSAFATSYLDQLDYDEPRHPLSDELLTYSFTIVTI